MTHAEQIHDLDSQCSCGKTAWVHMPGRYLMYCSEKIPSPWFQEPELKAVREALGQKVSTELYVRAGRRLRDRAKEMSPQ